jgi:hypothetical protein
MRASPKEAQVQPEVLDIEVADDTDVRWQELAEQALGPEDFLNPCTSGGTSYGPTFTSCNDGSKQQKGE